jgi:hypothetical protein
LYPSASIPLRKKLGTVEQGFKTIHFGELIPTYYSPHSVNYNIAAANKFEFERLEILSNNTFKKIK